MGRLGAFIFMAGTVVLATALLGPMGFVGAVLIWIGLVLIY